MRLGFLPFLDKNAAGTACGSASVATSLKNTLPFSLRPGLCINAVCGAGGNAVCDVLDLPGMCRFAMYRFGRRQSKDFAGFGIQ